MKILNCGLVIQEVPKYRQPNGIWSTETILQEQNEMVLIKQGFLEKQSSEVSFR